MATANAPTTHAQSFADLGVPATLVAALADAGITTPFPIQSATLPDSLAGRDVLGRGRTGSGKTFAFVLPMLARLASLSSKRQPKRPRALVLAPTRELASQIDAAMAPLARRLGLRTLTVFGGVSPQPQIRGLRNGVDIVVACPGRLADHLQSGHADLGSVEITVLDEADHMADLGFLPVVRRLLDRTPKGQRLLFSATLDRGVDALVKRYLHDPVTHSVDSVESPISQMTHHVLHVSKEGRLSVLADLTAAPGKTVVFTRTKHGAKSLGPTAQRPRRADGRAARQPVPERAHAQPLRLRQRLRHHAGGHGHRRPRHPRRRREPRRARGPACRAQGVPAPFRSHGSRGCRGHGRHADAGRAGEGRPRADPQGRHQADRQPHPAR